MKPLTVRFTDGQADRLAAAAMEAGVSRAEFVRRALNEAVALQAAGGPTQVVASPFPGPHQLRVVLDVVPEDADEQTKTAVAVRNASVLDRACRCGARLAVSELSPSSVPSAAAPGESDGPTFRPGVSRPPVIDAQTALKAITRPQIPRQVVLAHIAHRPACPASFRPEGEPA